MGVHQYLKTEIIQVLVQNIVRYINLSLVFYWRFELIEESNFRAVWGSCYCTTVQSKVIQYTSPNIQPKTEDKDIYENILNNSTNYVSFNTFIHILLLNSQPANKRNVIIVINFNLLFRTSDILVNIFMGIRTLIIRIEEGINFLLPLQQSFQLKQKNILKLWSSISKISIVK